MQAASSSIISASPSLNSYSASNNTLAEVAARVAHELRFDDGPLPFDWYEDHDQPLPTYYYQHEDEDEEEEEEEEEVEEEEFEFSFMCENPESSSLVPADEIFHNGQIKPIYSVFAGDSSEERGRVDESEVVKKSTRRPPLRVLMGVERAEVASSCSSSEADELDRIAPGTYCVWKPAAAACKKSSSTGSSASSSRRWKLRQLLLKRSISDGAKAVVLMAAKKVADGDGTEGGRKVESNVRRNHNNSRSKFFLPYRQDLVGFFANVKGHRMNLNPF